MREEGERGSVGISHALYYQGFDPVGRNWNFAARRLPWEQNALFKFIITIILTRGSKKISTVVLSWPCEKYMGELIFCTGSISWELGIHASSNELPLILIFWVKLDEIIEKEELFLVVILPPLTLSTWSTGLK